VRDNALQSPIASICTRLAAMKTGDRPRCDTGVIDDWDDNDSPCLLALREGAKFGDDQLLDLVFGLWDFFHDTTMTDFYCDDASRVAVRRSKHKAVEAFGPPSITFGACTLAGVTVITKEVAGWIRAWRRLFHSPG
jgi:hypothetical protein